MRAAETGSPPWVIKLTRRLAVSVGAIAARVRFPFLSGSELTFGSNSWCNASRETGYLDFFWDPWAEVGWQPDALLAFQFSVAWLSRVGPTHAQVVNPAFAPATRSCLVSNDPGPRR